MKEDSNFYKKDNGFDDMWKKLVDHYMEIEEYKYDLEKKQSIINEEIMSLLKYTEKKEYKGEYCYVSLEDNTEIKYSRYVKELYERGYLELLNIVGWKELLINIKEYNVRGYIDIYIDRDIDMDIYIDRDIDREYIHINGRLLDIEHLYKKYKKYLIKLLINNNRFDLITFDLDDIKKKYEDNSLPIENREYLGSIIKENPKSILKYYYI